MTAPAEDPRGGEVCDCRLADGDGPGCAAQPTQELREAIAATLWHAQPEFFVSPREEISETTREQYRTKADDLIAGPLAALLDAQAAVSRVEAVMAAWNRGEPVGGYLPREIHRALDGP